MGSLLLFIGSEGARSGRLPCGDRRRRVRVLTDWDCHQTRQALKSGHALGSASDRRPFIEDTGAIFKGEQYLTNSPCLRREAFGIRIVRILGKPDIHTLSILGNRKSTQKVIQQTKGKANLGKNLLYSSFLKITICMIFIKINYKREFVVNVCCYSSTSMS